MRLSLAIVLICLFACCESALFAQVPLPPGGATGSGTVGPGGTGGNKEVAYYDGSGTVLAGAKGFLYNGTATGGSVDVFDAATLGSESLTNGVLTGGTSWTQTGDMALAADAATYTHSSGVGTLQQASGTLAVAGVGSRHYRFVYTVSAVTAGVSCNITTAFASVTTLLTLTAATQTTDFISAASPGNFVISCTSTAGAITLDTLSLKEMQGGNVAAAGLFTGGGTAGLKIFSSGNVRFQPSSDSTTMFQVRNAAGTAMFNFDVTNGYLTATQFNGIIQNQESGNRLGIGGDVGVVTSLSVAPGTSTRTGFGIRAQPGQTESLMRVQDSANLDGLHISGTINIGLGSGKLFTWSATTDATAAKDLGLARNAAGIVEVNSGTAGKWAGIKSGLVALQSLAVPAAPTVTPTCVAACTQTWTYGIVAKLADGTTTEIGATGSTALQAATLDASNFNVITWAAVTGATSYDVRRTVSGGTPATLGIIGSPTVATFTDDGDAGDGTASPTSDLTGILNGIVRPANSAGNPTVCGTAIFGAMYFNTTDARLCICVADGTDNAWVKSSDYTHATGHCTP